MKTDFSNIIVLSDVDGTFSHGEYHTLTDNIAAVDKFKSLGGRFGFATGRCIEDLDDIIPSFRRLCNIPIGLCSGAMIYDCEKDSVVGGAPLGKEKADEMEADLCSRFPFLSPWRIEYRGETYNIEFSADRDKTDEVFRYANEKYGKDYWVVKSVETLVELLDKRGSKAGVVEYTRSHCKKDDIIFAFGDYWNDFEMFEAADYSACAQDCDEAVKEKCDFIIGNRKEGIMVSFLEKLIGGEIVV